MHESTITNPHTIHDSDSKAPFNAKSFLTLFFALFYPCLIVASSPGKIPTSPCSLHIVKHGINQRLKHIPWQGAQQSVPVCSTQEWLSREHLRTARVNMLCDHIDQTLCKCQIAFLPQPMPARSKVPMQHMNYFAKQHR